jgi:hypothetical protein
MQDDSTGQDFAEELVTQLEAAADFCRRSDEQVHREAARARQPNFRGKLRV